MKKTFVVVDDHPVFRHGLVALLESDPTYEVLAQAGSVAEALAILETTLPDLLLVDLSLQHEQSGLDLLAAVRERYPAVLTLVISTYNESVYADRALAAGARGYVMKQAPTPVLKEALRTVLNGKIYLSTETRLPSRAASAPPFPDPDVALSKREREVFELLGKGRGVTEIAGLLFLSAKTVGVHLEHVKIKLGLANNFELRRFAIEWTASRQ